jgi:hypothetical protein
MQTAWGTNEPPYSFKGGKQTINAYKSFVGKPEGKIFRRIRDNTNKMDHRGLG